MIRIITTKRLHELEKTEARWYAALDECRQIKRWCGHSAIVNHVASRLTDVLWGSCSEALNTFRDRIGLGPEGGQR